MSIDLAPPDVSVPIVALAKDPTPLAAELSKCEQTLVHGGARLSNMGLRDDALVMIDWGERTGIAPGPVEIAAFVAFDAEYLELSRDEVIDEYRSLTSDFVDDASVDLASSGGLVQLGCNQVLDLVLNGTDDPAATHTARWHGGRRRFARLRAHLGPDLTQGGGIRREDRSEPSRPLMLSPFSDIACRPGGGEGESLVAGVARCPWTFAVMSGGLSPAQALAEGSRHRDRGSPGCCPGTRRRTRDRTSRPVPATPRHLVPRE